MPCRNLPVSKVEEEEEEREREIEGEGLFTLELEDEEEEEKKKRVKEVKGSKRRGEVRVSDRVIELEV